MDTKQGMQEAEVKNIEKEAKLKKADQFRILSKAVNGLRTSLLDGKRVDFDNKYYVVHTDDLQRRILIERPNRTVAYCSDEAFKADIIKLASTQLVFHEYFSGFVDRTADEFLRFWKLFTKPIPEPRLIAMSDFEGLCFNRTDFKYHLGYTPEHYTTIDRLIGKNKNYEAVKHFLGSIFDPDADTQQVLVLHGEGMNGKSTLLNFLCRCLGDAVASSTAPDRYAKNFTAQFVGKRLGIFPDAENLEFMQGQHFKMMTGGDLIPIDQKYEKVYSKRLSCKFIISSNHKPELKGQKSDSRRIIYYEMPEVDTPDPQFIERLYEQREGIFCHLIENYFETVGSGVQIPVSDGQLDDILESNSIDEDTFFQKYFTVAAEGKTSVTTLNNCIYDQFGSSWPGKKDFRDSFDLYVRREHKIGKLKSIRSKQDDFSKPFKGYSGFELSYGNGSLACNQSTINLCKNLESKIAWYRNELKTLEAELEIKQRKQVTSYSPDLF